MLLRIEKLRQAAIRMSDELQRNRFSLQVVRESFQRSMPEADGSPLLALPASPASPAGQTRKSIQKERSKPDVMVTYSIDAPMFTSELKDILDREAVAMETPVLRV